MLQFQGPSAAIPTSLGPSASIPASIPASTEAVGIAVEEEDGMLDREINQKDNSKARDLVVERRL